MAERARSAHADGPVARSRPQSPRALRTNAEEEVYLRVDRSERRRQTRGTPEGGPPRTALVSMIAGTFGEMPGLSLHLAQAARLFGIRPDTCRVVLDDLVSAGRLRRLRDGQYTGV